MSEAYIAFRATVNRFRHRFRRMLVEVECFFTCPYCWEQISMVLDTSVKGQTYVEDCEVCCHPIEVRYTVEDGVVSDIDARALE